MKVLHLTCVRELTNGQRKQLSFEYEASKKLSLDWTVKALHIGEIIDKRFEQKIPKFFNMLILRNLYAWIYMLKNQKNYDVILNRHMTFDPFVFICGWFVKNRFTVHHAKDILELRLLHKKWQGLLASFFERISGFVNARQVDGIIGVTNDITQYMHSLYQKETFVYPNGINLSSVSLLEDKRIDDEVNIAFMCGTFSPWHGLDLLLESVLDNLEFIQEKNVKIHLIGRVLEKELDCIKINKLPIVLYGLMPSEKYVKVLETCDIGLNSFVMSRQLLAEGSTLKVKEYLSMGLSVYSGCKDTAIPIGFDCYKVDEVDIKKMIAFAKQMKQVSRQEVRDASEKYISKEIWLKNLYDELEKCSLKKRIKNEN